MMNKKSIFSLVFAAMAMTACNNENVVEIPNEIVEGKPATLTLSFNVENYNATRAEGIVLDSEATINDFHLYVFGSTKALEQCIDITDATKVNEFKTSKEVRLETTTGIKYFVASVNGAIKKTDGNVISAADKSLTFDQVKDLQYNVQAGTDANNAKRLTGGLQMVGSAYYSVKGVNSETVSIDMLRTVAKADVIMDAGFLNSLKSVANLSNATVTYTVRNVAKKAFYSNVTAFNTTTYLPTYEMRVPSSLTYFQQMEGSVTPANDFGMTGHTYLPENTLTADANGKIQLNSISYLLVEINFTPAKILNASGADVTSTANKANLWLSYAGANVKKDTSGKVIWYDSEAAAKAVGTPYHYTNQKMYYRVNLVNSTKTTDKDKYSIVRNTVYNVTLKTVKDFNETTPAYRVSDLDGLGAQLLGTSNLNVQIDAKKWDQISMGDITL